MISLKERYESDELRLLRFLNVRMTIPEKDQSRYLSLKRGFEGEVAFDPLIDTLQGERYVLKDLLLEVNHSFFQIDTLIISQGVIHLIDTKYFQGDWFYVEDKFLIVQSRREYKNPIDQLKRCVTLFNQWLHKQKLNFIVEALVVFNHPEFTLYQAPMDLPIVLPTQIPHFFKKLDETPSQLGDPHKKLAQELLTLHHNKNPFFTPPEYTYDQLKKGIYCENCHSFALSKKDHIVFCRNCGTSEPLGHAILRAANEFRLLFPEEKITTKEIYNWCKFEVSTKTISRLLNKNFKANGITRYRYFQ